MTILETLDTIDAVLKTWSKLLLRRYKRGVNIETEQQSDHNGIPYSMIE